MVPRIGLGGHYNGPTHREKKADELWQRKAVFRECLKQGINFLDTNNEYERKSLGMVLKSVTDINDRTQTGPDTYDFLMQKIDEQLGYLQLPSVDILRFTTVARRTPPERIEAAFRAFKDIKKAGKATFLGVSQHDPDLLIEWIDKYDEIDIIYAPYNYFATKAQVELFPAARKKDIGVIVIKPFNKGTIFNPSLLESKWARGNLARVLELGGKGEDKKELTSQSLTKGTGLNLAQASLRYILSNEDVSMVIPGMETPDEVRENVQVAETGKLGALDRKQMEHRAHHLEDALPENYQWLKHWRHA
jgi:aryl-alcohol dehydrogenase-like predicted oxidoreductase